jgi:hypothetical protein
VAQSTLQSQLPVARRAVQFDLLKDLFVVDVPVHVERDGHRAVPQYPRDDLQLGQRHHSYIGFPPIKEGGTGAPSLSSSFPTTLLLGTLFFASWLAIKISLKAEAIVDMCILLLKLIFYSEAAPPPNKNNLSSILC